jgi:hypothetical protein
MTVSTWIYLVSPTTLPAPSHILTAAGSSGGGCGGSCIRITNTVPSGFGLGMTNYFAKLVPKPTQGVWTNYAYSWDGTNFKLYINGSSVVPTMSGSAASVGADSWGGSATGGLIIGGTYSGGEVTTSSDNVYLDDVSVYNSALSAADIGHMYAEGLKTHQLADSK